MRTTRGRLAHHLRVAGAGLVTAALSLTLLGAPPAQAANPTTPRHFTGYGFDQCQAPSQAEMDVWRETSPYWAVGIYIAGDLRYCSEQENLDATWVRAQLRKGWRLLPLTVGRQAACTETARYQHHRISGKPADNYAAARQQGREEATSTVRTARSLGITRGSTLWYDLEAFPTTSARCRESSLAFLSAWTTRLHQRDYRSGVYSSAASGIKTLDESRRLSPGRWVMPDQLWVAEWMDGSRYRQPPRATPPSFTSAYYDASGWSRKVMRQYRGDHDETHGGVTINIDTNYLDLGRGSRPGRAAATCGVNVNFQRYPRLRGGSRGPEVRALQCLLKQRGDFRKKVNGIYTVATGAAVRRFHDDVGLRSWGRTSARTWTALLAGDATPVVKIGSAGEAVRRVQRALNAADRAGLNITGVFDVATTQAVRTYQRDGGLARHGVVSGDTWVDLASGRL